MNDLRWWRSPHAGHAVRVALVASVVIAALYVCLVGIFDLVDHHHVVAQVDAKVSERLADAALHVATASGTDNFDNAHDADDAPVFLWRAGPGGRPQALIAGAPALTRSDWSASGNAVVVALGSEQFLLQAREVGGTWLIAGQSLASADHVRLVLLVLEAVAGPFLVVAVFCGTLLVGLKAAGPVEEARRNQLEFTADASHELRTPLSVIEAEVSLALSGTRTADDYRDTLSRVSRESIRLRDIVNDLLWLSRFDAEPPPPGDEPVDVSAIASACADRFSAVAQQRDLTLVVQQGGDEHPWIKAPPEWVDRLTAVLVDNACRYAGPAGTVRIVVQATGSKVSLAVEDTGPGIAPEARARLFDRFHRATDEGNGAGLGLAIADSVVQATGGEWRVERSDLGGARMEVHWHRAAGRREPRQPGLRDEDLADRSTRDPSVVL